jgi:hypothetical protein
VALRIFDLDLAHGLRAFAAVENHPNFGGNHGLREA